MVGGDARSKTSLRNLGDPSRWLIANVGAEIIRLVRPFRESDAFIVVLKRVTTVERRDATVGQRSWKQGVPLDGNIHYGGIGVCGGSRDAGETLSFEMEAGSES